MRLKIPQVTRRSNTSELEYRVCCLFVRNIHGPRQGVAVLGVEFAEELVLVIRVDAEADGLINESSTSSNFSRRWMEEPGV